jgi:hypothetical protein
MTSVPTPTATGLHAIAAARIYGAPGRGRSMAPDADTLTFLLVLANEFISDDGLHWVGLMDEESVDYWELPYAAACWPCKRVRDDAVFHGRRILGLTVPEAHAIAYWRPVRDGAAAAAFLQEHEGCGTTPLALRLPEDGGCIHEPDRSH